MPWFEPAGDTIRSCPEDDSTASGGGDVFWDLIAELASAKPARRRLAAERLQDHNRTDLAPHLLNLLKSVTAGVRQDAAETLGFIGYDIAEDACKGLQGLLYDPDADVRETAVVALWRLNGQAALPDLQRVMCFDTEPKVRLAVSRMLSTFENPASNSYFEYSLTDTVPLVRANAAAGLGLARHEEARGRIQRLLETEQHPVARAGLLCASWLMGGGPRVLEDLLKLARIDGEVAAELCYWTHLYLDRKPSGPEATRDLGRIAVTMRHFPGAVTLLERIAVWQGDAAVQKSKSAGAGS